MNGIEKNLALIASARNYAVKRYPEGRYVVRDDSADLMACYEYGVWAYYVTDVYDSGTDEAIVDIEALNRMVEFTRLLAGATKEAER